jgi:uncharacterized protein YndB with AHSA1/START domain
MSHPAVSPVIERTLYLTRIFNAPRSLVFQAWTDPQQLAQWWGPTGFTNPVCELDLRPHGEIRIDMRAPDGTVYPMAGAFQEIVEPERLVFTSAALNSNGKPMFENLNTVTFEEFEGSKTLLTLTAKVLWETPEAAPYLAGMNEGWSRTIDRLDDFMVATAGVQLDMTDASPHPGTSERELRATRIFNASRELVYRMWTEGEHLSKWWGPNGFTTTVHQMDVRPGGEWRLTMHGPDGRDFPNRSVYIEVVPQERLVYDHLSGPPFRMSVTFTELGAKTEVRVHMLFASAALRDRVVAEFHADKGLTQTLDHLAEYLERVSSL